MNVDTTDGPRCCAASADRHTDACARLWDKWVIRRDGFCDDPAKSYTVWRHSRCTAMFWAWHTCATRHEAHAHVDTLIRTYTVNEENA
jgi:hypothetical protein